MNARRRTFGLGMLASLGLAFVTGCAHNPDVGLGYGNTVAQAVTPTPQTQANDDLLAWELRHAFADGDRFRQLELCAELGRNLRNRGTLSAGLARLVHHCQASSKPEARVSPKTSPAPDHRHRHATAAALTAQIQPPPAKAQPPKIAWDFDGPGDDRPRTQGPQHFAHPGSGRYCQARLPDSADIELRRPHRSYGSPATLEMIGHIARRHVVRSGGVPLLVGDICQQGGGPISGHRSHQTGYDADIGLPFRDQAGTASKFATATRESLDLEGLWHLLLDLSGERRLKRVFLDYEVQGWVYDWALQHGATREQLERLLQYPYGERAARGLVRHWPKHRDHLHLRLAGPQRILHAI